MRAIDDRFTEWLEAVVVGAVSSLAAIGVALPLSITIGIFIGQISFAVSLPLVLSAWATVGWAVVAVIFWLLPRCCLPDEQVA